MVNPESHQRDLDRKRGKQLPPRPPIPTPTKSRKPTEPWHHEAKALMAEIGPKYAEIGRRVGKGKDAVRRFLDYRANERYLERHHARYVRDQQYREKRQAQARAWHAKQREARSAPPPP